MKAKQITWVLAGVFFWSGLAAATLDIYEDRTITDGENFTNVNIWNNASVQMTGGRIAMCNIYNASVLNYEAGELDYLVAFGTSEINVRSNYDYGFELRESSKAYLHNGSALFQILIVSNATQLHVYGYDLVYTPSSPGLHGFISGRWEDSNQYFELIVRHAGNVTPQDIIFLHEIPEPASIFLLAMGVKLIAFKRTISLETVL